MTRFKFLIILIITYIVLLHDGKAQNSQAPQLSLTEQLAYSTVRLVVELEHGTSVGTSFFLNLILRIQ